MTLLEPVEGLLADLNVAEVAHTSGLTRMVMDALMLGVEFGRDTIGEQAAWGIASMLQNNFPVQEEFFTNYGEEFLSLQQSAFSGGVTELAPGGKRSKLFFWFSSFLRGGSLEAVELAAPFMRFVLKSVQDKLTMISGSLDTMLIGDMQTNK